MIEASRAMKERLKREGALDRQAARRQDAGDDLRPALDPHARLVRRRHAPARRRVDHADRPGDAARPRRDHRRHRARALALRRRDHDPHPRARDAAGARRACDRAGDQRAHPALASLPGAGRRDDLRGASRLDPRQDRRLDRRRQQRAGVVGAGRRPLRVPAAGRDAAGAQAEEVAHRLDQDLRRRHPHRHRPGGGGQGRRLRGHRHLGVDGRQGRRRAATTCSSAIRSTPG